MATEQLTQDEHLHIYYLLKDRNKKDKQWYCNFCCKLEIKLKEILGDALRGNHDE